MSRVDVSTTQISETTNDLKVSISSYFEYDIPEVNELQSAEACIKLLVEKHGHDEVYKLVKGQLAIVTQAPARKELIEQWTSINPEVRATLITLPKEGVVDGVATATLPEPQRLALQQRMDEFKLGEKASRTRVVRMTEDPIDAIARRISSGEIQGEELDALRARAMELLGLSGQAQGQRRR